MSICGNNKWHALFESLRFSRRRHSSGRALQKQVCGTGEGRTFPVSTHSQLRLCRCKTSSAASLVREPSDDPGGREKKLRLVTGSGSVSVDSSASGATHRHRADIQKQSTARIGPNPICERERQELPKMDLIQQVSGGQSSSSASGLLRPEAVPPVTGFGDVQFSKETSPRAVRYHRGVSEYAPPVPFPTYEAFCDRLYKQNMFTMKLGLNNVEQALLLEGNPHLQHQRVFVAGTNGKGTVCSSLSNILTAGGYKVGFFSSPHLIDFRERFRVNGVPVSTEMVHQIGVEIVAKYGGSGSEFSTANLSPIRKRLSSANSSGSTTITSSPSSSTLADGVQPLHATPLPDEVTAALENGNRPVLTFFELATLIAVRVFAEAKVDVAIYEIGLGGRLDAVNGLRPPDLSLFATMGFDHMTYLGDTIGKIAYEKFSVMPRFGQAVLGEQEYEEETLQVWQEFVQNREMQTVVDMARDVGGPRGGATSKLDEVAEFIVSKSDEELSAYLSKPTLDRHICRHLRTAVAGSRILAPEIPETAIRQGLTNLYWPGRMETVVYKGQKFLIDAAHNIDGVRSLLRALVARKRVRIRSVVFGAMRDKDFGAMLSELRQLNAPFYGVEIQNPRAARQSDYDRIAGVGENGFKAVGPLPQVLEEVLSMKTAPSVQEENGDLEDTILVCGSIYLIGELYSTMGIDAGSIWRAAQNS
ncbi:unnamed protein product [Amoebophrya sp. A120]|nr:unnamed protein product [Amoebophrya sp. A120]|eukprot:GSA120T00002719001.1